MSDAPDRPHLRPRPDLTPALPRLAEMAADDLAVPLRRAADALREIEQWFVQHGDPFPPLDPEQFLARLRAHQFNTAPASTVAELMARVMCDLAALKERLDLAAE